MWLLPSGALSAPDGRLPTLASNTGRVDIYVLSNSAKQREWESYRGLRQKVGGRAGDERGDTESCPVPAGTAETDTAHPPLLTPRHWLKTHWFSALRPPRSQKETKANVFGPGISLQQQPLKIHHVVLKPEIWPARDF